MVPPGYRLRRGGEGRERPEGREPRTVREAPRLLRAREMTVPIRTTIRVEKEEM